VAYIGALSGTGCRVGLKRVKPPDYANVGRLCSLRTDPALSPRLLAGVHLVEAHGDQYEGADGDL
jgi:hypothetical protein